AGPPDYTGWPGGANAALPVGAAHAAQRSKRKPRRLLRCAACAARVPAGLLARPGFANLSCGRGGAVVIVAAITRSGKVCERYATHEEAQRRVDGLLAEGVIGLPLLYQELADGSQRLVREDGKPLQWHRMTEEIAPAADAPVPLSEDTLDL